MTSPRLFRALAALAAVVAVPGVALAEVKVDALIGDHMVVQRDRPLRLGGTAEPGEAVTATIAAAKASTKADARGRWAVTLPALAAGGPVHADRSGGRTTLTFTDVWAGEVWIASGQSNMEFPLQRSKGGADAAALRLLRAAPVHRREPAGRGARDEGGRRVAAPATPRTRPASRRSAFHFGREMHRALGVPVGIVHTSVGRHARRGLDAARGAARPTPTLAPMVDALDRAMSDTALHDELAKKLAAWEAKNFHQDTGNRGEKHGWARAGGGRWRRWRSRSSGRTRAWTSTARSGFAAR